MDETLKFDEVPNIEAFTCVLGLKFPESATEFQKAFLTMANLCVAAREYVLKGIDVPHDVLTLIDQLNIISLDNEYKQR